jgi:hypothetical protein
VEVAGSPSWQLTEAEGDRAHVLLYIRDVAALEVPADVDAPPRLVGLPPPRATPVLDDERRRQAGRDWTSWWQALVEVERQGQFGTDDLDGDASLRAWVEGLGRVFDPPEFGSLADRPALHEVTVALYAEARRWVDAGPGNPSRLRGGGHFPWETVSATAEGVVAERGVSPDAVRGMVVVLDVEGVWSRRVAPGAVLCSAEATRDRRSARAVLRDVFESGLT